MNSHGFPSNTCINCTNLPLLIVFRAWTTPSEKPLPPRWNNNRPAPSFQDWSPRPSFANLGVQAHTIPCMVYVPYTWLISMANVGKHSLHAVAMGHGMNKKTPVAKTLKPTKWKINTYLWYRLIHGLYTAYSNWPHLCSCSLWNHVSPTVKSSRLMKISYTFRIDTSESENSFHTAASEKENSHIAKHI